MSNKSRHITRSGLVLVALCILAACRKVPQARRILFTTVAQGHLQIIALDREARTSQVVVPEGIGNQSASDPVWSPQGDAILYRVWDEESQQASLWLMQPDGSNTRRLASSFRYAPGWPGEWSFDGWYVAYCTRPDRQDPATWNLVIADVDTMEAREIVTGAWGCTWSPTEHLIAVCRWAGDASGLYVFGVDGSQQYTLTITETQHLSPPLLCSSWMAWRPNSWEITFGCEPTEESDFKEVCIVDPRSGEVQTLTQGQGNYSYRRASVPAWSADGRRILFMADYGTFDGEEVQNALFVLDTATGEECELAGGLAGFAPVWSPDGQEVAFIAPGEGGGEIRDTQIFIVNVRTGQITQLTHDDTLKLSLEW